MHYYTRFKNHEHSYQVTHKHTFITMVSVSEILNPPIVCFHGLAGAETAENC